MTWEQLIGRVLLALQQPQTWVAFATGGGVFSVLTAGLARMFWGGEPDHVKHRCESCAALRTKLAECSKSNDAMVELVQIVSQHFGATPLDIQKLQARIAARRSR